MTGVRATLAVLLLGLAACGNQGLQKTAPALLIDGGPVDFGAQPVLSPVTRTIHFSNVGRAGMTWTAQLTDFDSGPLDLDASTPADLDGGDAGAASDAGSPGDAGPTTVDAGGATVDAGSADAGPVFVLSVADGGDSSGGMLGAGASVDEIVTFNAPVEASYSANFVLTTSDMLHPTTTIQITGQATTSASIKVAPPCIDFGSVPATGVAEVKELTISSVGTAPLEIESMTITPPSPVFEIEGSASAGTIPNGSPLTLGVSCDTQAAPAPANNVFTSNLQIATNDPNHRIVDVCLTCAVEQLPTCVISVEGQNQGQTRFAPNSMTPIMLSDEMSSAPAGQTITKFQWDLPRIPMGSDAMACATSDAGTNACPLLVDLPGEYDVQLTCTDSDGQSATTLQKIIGATSDALEVELTWDTSVGDLDLHFFPVIPTDGGPITTGLNSICDCNGDNQTPMDPSCHYIDEDAGMPGGPVDTGDVLSGYGPETVNYVAPNAGEYQITVIYYSDQGNPGLNPNATVRVYLFGTVAYVFHTQLTSPGQRWDVGWIDWPSGVATSGLAP